MKRLVAFLFHAPGLYVVYRERLPWEMVKKNLVAIAVTLAAMLGTGVVAGPLAAILAWGAGHAAWGAYLAWWIPSAGSPS
ncbi:MAG TPA: hypothetical protein VFQ53_31025 [Kofleriaceae bacterium]|nr:hypothetical protein [Kofleriaceae bacterium]